MTPDDKLVLALVAAGFVFLLVVGVVFWRAGL
jgi:hypothetical protein